MLLPLFEFGRFILSQYIATMLWLMLLPCGRCYHHCCSYSCMLMADVIAMWQMEKPHFCEADVIAQWQMEWPLQGVGSPG